MTNRQIWVTVLTAAGLAWGSVAARGDELARWNSTDANTSLGSYKPTASVEGLTVSNLAVQAGLSAGGSSAANVYAAYGYSATDYAAAVKATNYWEVCLDPKGNMMTLTSLTYSFGGPQSGPKQWQWVAKVGDKGAWTEMGTPTISERTSTKYIKETVNLSELGLTTTPTTNRVWFRFVAWGGGTRTDACGNFGQKTDVLKFEGTLVRKDGAPQVMFIPATGSVNAGNPLVMTVSLFPEGSGVKSYEFTPPPVGSHSLSGNAITFNTAEDDALNEYTLSVTATNKNGTTTATARVFVLEAAPPGTLTLTFDNETQPDFKGEDNVEIPIGSGIKWDMTCFMISTNATQDKLYRGTGGALRSAYQSNCTFESKVKIPVSGTLSSDLQIFGLKEVRFKYGVYGADTTDTSKYSSPPPLVTELSDDRINWVEVDRVLTEDGKDELQERKVEVGLEGPVYFRLRIEGSETSSRVNVDQLQFIPFALSQEEYVYRQGLLRYNVTPGDKETEEDEDWDGDGVMNATELNNGTNPYDKNSK